MAKKQAKRSTKKSSRTSATAKKPGKATVKKATPKPPMRKAAAKAKGGVPASRKAPSARQPASPAKRAKARPGRGAAALSDPFHLVRSAGTDGANYDLDNAAILATLQAWTQLCQFAIKDAAHDTIEIEFTTMPADMDAFVRDLYDFCPDLVDQGTGCMQEMLEASEEAGMEISPEIQELVEGINFSDENYGLEILKRELNRHKRVTLWWD